MKFSLVSIAILAWCGFSTAYAIDLDGYETITTPTKIVSNEENNVALQPVSPAALDELLARIESLHKEATADWEVLRPILESRTTETENRSAGNHQPVNEPIMLELGEFNFDVRYQPEYGDVSWTKKSRNMGSFTPLVKADMKSNIVTYITEVIPDSNLAMEVHLPNGRITRAVQMPLTQGNLIQLKYGENKKLEQLAQAPFSPDDIVIRKYPRDWSKDPADRRKIEALKYLLLDQPPSPEASTPDLRQLIARGDVKLTTQSLQIILNGIDDPATALMCLDALWYITDKHLQRQVEDHIADRFRHKDDASTVSENLLKVMRAYCTGTTSSLELALQFLHDSRQPDELRAIAAVVVGKCGGVDLLMERVSATDEEALRISLPQLAMMSQTRRPMFADRPVSPEQRARIQDWIFQKLSSSSPVVRRAAVEAVSGLAMEYMIRPVPGDPHAASDREQINLYKSKLEQLKITESDKGVLEAIKLGLDYLKKISDAYADAM